MPGKLAVIFAGFATPFTRKTARNDNVTNFNKVNELKLKYINVLIFITQFSVLSLQITPYIYRCKLQFAIIS